MKYGKVDLAKEYGLKGGKLSCIAIDVPWDPWNQPPNWKRPAVIIVPGGGYEKVSRREGEPTAMQFIARGFQAFVLNYTVGGEKGAPYPEQLFEAAACVDYVKKHAQEYGVNPEEVFVIGFSAGGHIVGDLAVEYQDVSAKWGKKVDCKPTAVGLCYPVISQIHGHQLSFDNVLYGYSDTEKQELLKTLNLDESVTENTPPAFIWTTAEDTLVPPDNAMRFAMALDKKGVAFELHVYPKGQHGKATGHLESNIWKTEEDAKVLARIVRWTDDCASFFRMFVAERFQ